MPPAVAVAGIAAAGAVGSAAIGASSAKKASKAQQQAAVSQIAAAERNRDYQYGLNAPTITAGNNASGAIQGLLNVGGDPAAARASLDAFRGSSGYQDLLNTGLASVNSNAYARGMGDSGAALKALQAKGSAIADQSMQGYLGNLTNLASMGGQARSLVAGVGGNTVGMVNQATQGAADARSNAALATGAGWSNALSSLAQVGGAALGSSYGGGQGSFNPATLPPFSIQGAPYNPALFGGSLALPSQRGW